MNWEALSTIVAVFVFIFTAFLEWPRFRTRWAESKVTDNLTKFVLRTFSVVSVISGTLVGLSPFYWIMASVFPVPPLSYSLTFIPTLISMVIFGVSSTIWQLLAKHIGTGTFSNAPDYFYCFFFLMIAVGLVMIPVFVALSH